MRQFAVSAAAVVLITTGLILAQDIDIEVERFMRPIGAVLLMLAGVGVCVAHEFINKLQDANRKSGIKD